MMNLIARLFNRNTTTTVYEITARRLDTDEVETFTIDDAIAYNNFMVHAYIDYEILNAEAVEIAR